MYKLIKTESEIIGRFKISKKPIIAKKETVLYSGNNKDFAYELMNAFLLQFSVYGANGVQEIYPGRYFSVSNDKKTTTYRLDESR